MTEAEEQFAAALARGIAEDLRDHPPDGPLVRFVLRWFEEDDPLYFTLHALGAGEVGGVPAGSAWEPLEWANAERELERADRVRGQADVARAGEALEAAFVDISGEPEDDDPEEGEWAASDAIVGALARLPDALRAAGVEADPAFMATATHFEAFGGGDVMRRMGRQDWLAELESRGEAPYDL